MLLLQFLYDLPLWDAIMISNIILWLIAFGLFDLLIWSYKGINGLVGWLFRRRYERLDREMLDKRIKSVCGRVFDE